MGDRNIRARFRHYKWMWGGVSNLRILDGQQIIATIDIMRAYDPNQADAIRKAAKEQLQRQVNPKADDMQQQEVATPEPAQLTQPEPVTPEAGGNE